MEPGMEPLPESPKSDRELTGEEKRAKLREEYKRELMARKQIEQEMRGADKMAKIQRELSKMSDALTDDTDEWIAKLRGPADIAEAKLDMALESMGADSSEATAEGNASRSKTLLDTEKADSETGSDSQSDESGSVLDRPKPQKSLGDLEL